MAKKSPTHSEKEIQERFEAMKVVHGKVLALKTPLAEERRANKVHPVIGEGSHFANIMFVGEAPGKNEAIQGRPFCGASGKFLSAMLESVGLKREDVYITNIVKDRPTDNRDPSPDEILAYGEFLDKQIEIIQPKIIATLGRISMAYVMSKFGLENELAPISQIHGKAFDASVPAGGGETKTKLKTKTETKTVKIIALYHPAVALYNGGMRSVLLKDFEVFKQF